MRVDNISLEKKHWGLLRICRLEANGQELGRWMDVASTVGWRKGTGGKEIREFIVWAWQWAGIRMICMHVVVPEVEISIERSWRWLYVI
jgi:hypothetical protein